VADICAFRAHRYDLGRVGALSDVVAPPYDVIDAELQNALYDRHPWNVVRLILNKETPADNEHDNRYTRSANLLRELLADDVLVHDTARSLYAYHQEFTIDGQSYMRRGFLARVRLEPFGTGRIFPHEHTLAGPRTDRLNLFRATAMNLSPVFGLYPDPEQEVSRLLDSAIGRSLPIQATDHLGVVNQLWPLSDQHLISQVTGLLGPKPVFLADGHHRYETGLRYLEERRAAGEVPDDEHPANFILMMLVGMSDPGLVILPTHRLISGLDGLSADQLAERLAPCFSLERIGIGERGARDTWELMMIDGSQEVLGFGTVSDGIWQLARFRSPGEMATLAADHSARWRGLAVAVLHVLVLDRLLRPTATGTIECKYVHQLDEVLSAAARRQCSLAALVPPASMDDVEAIAGHREKMPPKSTYFYPKLLSGLVFNSLRGN
jgi:uncharacterized protein (DUF1015 family)